MELFTIQCTTCRARLKVNDASIIGDILACPKCNSMVLVAPPEGWQSPGAAPAAAPLPPAPAKLSPTKSGPLKPAAPALPKLSASTTTTAPAIAATAAPVVAAAAGTVVPPPLPASAAIKTEPASAELAMTGEPAAASRLSSSLGWIVERVRRDWIAIGGGIGLGASMWLAITWATSSSESTNVGAVATVSAAAPTDPESVEPTVEATTEEMASAEPAAPEENTEPVAAAPAAAQPAAEAQPQAAEPVVNVAEVAPPAASVPQPTVKLDPAPASPPPSEPVAQAAPPASSKTEPAEPMPAVSAVPAAAREAGISPGVTVPTLSAAEIEDRMSQPLASIAFDKTPLVKYLDFLHEMTGVTIAIDDSALAKAGVDRQAPITIRLNETTAGDALRAAAAKLGLQCKLRDGKLVVTAQGN